MARIVIPASVEAYSLDRIYSAASDVQGHSWRTRISLPQWYGGSIQSLIETPEFRSDYPTANAFVRDAIYHRMHYWADHDRPTSEDLYALLAGERVRSTLAAGRRYRDHFNNLYEDLDKTMNDLQAHGKTPRDREAILRMLQTIEDEVTVYLREPYQTMILERVAFWRRSAGI